ncbi:MAG: hypothetical protein KKB38_20595 [Gammaproteobacteria bacterium]|nr:hypothetical protein [Gammaproteobacteria bacterium]
MNEVVEIPDDLAGRGMAVIRNFILEYCHEKNEKNILMLDDDIREFGFYQKEKWHVLDEERFLIFAQNAFLMCEELKTKLWGVNVVWDKRFYRENLPFSFGNIVLGPCCGIVYDEKMRFDERLGLKEDYDYSIQALNRYRKILRFNKYFYVMKHITSSGGCRVYRNQEKEIEQSQTLQKKWGSRIVKIERKAQHGNVSINPLINIPIKGV